MTEPPAKSESDANAAESDASAPEASGAAPGDSATNDSETGRAGTSDGKRTPLRARFLDALPDDPELRALGDAFEAGNYARVRAKAPRLIQASDREDVRAAARDLLARIEPDPLVKYLLVLTLLLLLGITAFAYGSHGHG